MNSNYPTKPGYSQPAYNAMNVPVASFPNFEPPVISTQPHLNVPTTSGWMEIPANLPNCPPGLEYLTMLDQLLVKQQVNLTQIFTGFEMNNKFQVKNTLGQDVYWVIEDNDCCTRNCFGSIRPFDMKVWDVYQNEIIHMYRPLACQSCCFPCCLQTLEVSAPPGNVVGTVEQEWTCCFPHFSIKNHNGDTVLRIEGPFCTMSCGQDIEFKILSLNGTEVGKISKQWSGFTREFFTTADYFGISFPMDLDVRMKAVMLGACMLINSMFYEQRSNNNNINDNIVNVNINN